MTYPSSLSDTEWDHLQCHLPPTQTRGRPRSHSLRAVLDAALEQVRLCASGPLCAEHAPQEAVLHGAACHACLFAPETSCERGNKYLDRSVLVETFGHGEYAFFSAGSRG